MRMLICGVDRLADEIITVLIMIIEGGVAYHICSLRIQHLLDESAHHLGIEGLDEAQTVDLIEKGLGLRTQHISGEERDGV